MKRTTVLVRTALAIALVLVLGVVPTVGHAAVPLEFQTPVAAALRDAATRLNVDPEQVQVNRLERHEWLDGSVGCPQPGMYYVQVMTPGYLVLIVGAGKQLEYHTDTQALAMFCREA
jgi:hypothetical protein